jgi:predicted TIM-barrel fold metal-dependent hydrolase
MAIPTEWLISVDDHVVEPPTLWSERLPSKYRDVGPRVERIGGLDHWVYEDKRVPMFGVASIIGQRREDWSLLAINYDDLDPSAWQPGARIAAMDEGGMLAGTPFPTYPRFCGQVFLEAKDKELALLGVQAWNDFIIDEWAGYAPGRCIPLAMVPLWDAELAAAEATRAIEKGARGIIFCENPTALGLPSIHDHGDYWDPLFALANETGLPICMHFGSSSSTTQMAPDAPMAVSMAVGPLNSMKALADWMLSGQFFRFPNLKIALSEGEIGWMPFALHWIARMSERHVWMQRTDFEFDFGLGNYTEKPLARKVIDPDYPAHLMFRDHVYGCFIDDPVGVELIDHLGIDNVMIECDFPHSAGTWPDAVEIARKQLEHLDAEDMTKVLSGNACRLFQFEPADPPAA